MLNAPAISTLRRSNATDPEVRANPAQWSIRKNLGQMRSEESAINAILKEQHPEESPVSPGRVILSARGSGVEFRLPEGYEYFATAEVVGNGQTLRSMMIDILRRHAETLLAAADALEA